MEKPNLKEKLPKGNMLRLIATRCLSYWQDNLDASYKYQEITLRKLFELYPTNTDFNVVMVKVATLDSFYSTNLKSVCSMAKQIYFNRDFDQMLQEGKQELVDKMCKIIGYTPFSFSTKYCSHHCPDKYPIYDSLVASLLIYYQDTEDFLGTHEKLSPQKLSKSYAKYFYPTIEKFRKVYNLEEYTFKELDRILWTLAKTIYCLNEDDRREILRITWYSAKIDKMLIKIEDDESVTVYERCSNTRVALEDIAKNEGYVISKYEKDLEIAIRLTINGHWDDEEEHGAKIGNYYIVIGEEENVIVYEKKDNSRGCLRDIVETIKYSEFDPGWNTRKAGRKIVDYVHEHPECLPK